MKISHRIRSTPTLLLGLALLFGCAQTPEESATAASAPEPQQEQVAAAEGHELPVTRLLSAVLLLTGAAACSTAAPASF